MTFHILKKRIALKLNNDSFFINFLDYSYIYTVIFVIFYPLLSSFDVLARILMFLSVFHVFLVYSVIYLLPKREVYLVSIFIATAFFLKLLISGFTSGFLTNYFEPSASEASCCYYK